MAGVHGRGGASVGWWGAGPRGLHYANQGTRLEGEGNELLTELISKGPRHLFVTRSFCFSRLIHPRRFLQNRIHTLPAHRRSYSVESDRSNVALMAIAKSDEVALYSDPFTRQCKTVVQITIHSPLRSHWKALSVHGKSGCFKLRRCRLKYCIVKCIDFLRRLWLSQRQSVRYGLKNASQAHEYLCA